MTLTVIVDLPLSVTRISYTDCCDQSALSTPRLQHIEAPFAIFIAILLLYWFIQKPVVYSLWIS